MGVDAVGDRSESWNDCVESVGLGTIDGKDRAREAAAGAEPAAQDGGFWATGGGRVFVQGGGCAGGGFARGRQAGAGGGPELVATAADGGQRGDWRAERGAAPAEFAGGGVEVDGRADRQAG